MTTNKTGMRRNKKNHVVIAGNVPIGVAAAFDCLIDDLTEIGCARKINKNKLIVALITVACKDNAVKKMLIDEISEPEEDSIYKKLTIC